MRVLLLTPDFPPATGGIQLLMHRLASNLPDAAVHVVASGTPGASSHDAAATLEITRSADKGSERNKLAVAALNATAIRAGLRRRPDAIVSGHAVTAPAAVALRRATGAPVAQYLHADEMRRRRALTGFAVRRADRVVAVSSYARELALSAGADPARIRIVHLGVDPVSAPVGERCDRPTIVTVARMEDSHKGHDVLIRALPVIREKVPDVKWIAIGDGRLRPGLEGLARELGVSDAARFVGNVGDTERDAWLARSHVFALPSRLPPGGVGGEGFGIVYLEAGATGLPVVAGDAGGAVDAVVDGETGVLVDARDHRALADAIAGLLLDRERAEALGTAGARRAAEMTWPRHAGEVRRLIGELVPGASSG